MRRSISTVLAAIIAAGVSMAIPPSQAAPVRIAPALAVSGSADSVLQVRDWRDRGERGDWVYSQRPRNWRYGPDGENRGYDRDRYRHRHSHHRYRQFAVPSPFFYGFPFFAPPRYHHYNRHHRRHRWD
jgi:hypothetical protein